MTEADQKLQLASLERRWAILDATKDARTRIPLVLNALVLGLTSFVLGKDTSLPSQSMIWAAALAGVISLVGLLLLATIHRQYNYSNMRVHYLYKKLELDGEAYQPPESASQASGRSEKGGAIWVLTYALMVLIGVSSVVAIYYSGPE